MTAPALLRSLRRGALVLLCASAPIFRAAESEASEAETVGDALSLYAPEVVWTGTVYLAAGVGVIYTSPDGTTWTKVHETQTELAYIALGGGRCVIAGGDAIWTADIGAIPNFNTSTIEGANIVDVTFGDGVFVLLDKRGGIWTGDGRSPWQRGSLGANPEEIETCSLAFGNGRWVAAANWDAGIVFTTTDPRGAWTRVSPPTTVGMLSRVVHGPSGFVIAGNGVSTAKSRDGTTWEAGPELFMDGPTWDLVATREIYYLWRDMHARSTDGLEWEAINPSQWGGWQSLLVREDTAQLLINTDYEQRVIDVAIAEEEARLQYAEYMQAQLDAQPDYIDLVVDEPVRVQAFNGADVNGFALSRSALFAATNAGLFRSEDGRAWEPFGGITTPVTHIAASKHGILLATAAGLQFGHAETGTFAPVTGVNVRPLQLDAEDYTFAILGTEGEVFTSTDGESWTRQNPLPGARVVSIDLDVDGGFHAAIHVADGVQHYQSWADEWVRMGEDTLLRPAVRDVAHTSHGFLALVDVPANARPLLATLKYDGWVLHELDTTQTIADAHHDGYISFLATAEGGLLGFNPGHWWTIFEASDLKLRTVFSTGNIVIAGGSRGEIVLAPNQVPDEASLIAAKTVANLPPGLQVADGAEVFKANDKLQRVVSANGAIYGVTTTGTVQRWNGSRFEPDANFSDVTGATDVAGTVHEIRALAGPKIEIRRRNNIRSSSTHENPKLMRIFSGPGRWLMLWEGNLAADTHSPNVYSKMELAKDFTVRDAAYAAANWVIVGARADGTGGVITSKNRRWFDNLRPTNSPALNAVVHDGTRYIAVGDGGVILTSPTGHTWQSHTLPGAPKLIDVAHGAGRTVALTEDGRVFSLKNGAWQPVLEEAKNPFRHVAGTPELLVLAGDQLHVTWTAPAVATAAAAAPVTQPTTHVAIPGESVTSLLWDGKQFLAVTENLIFASRDGHTFTPEEAFIDYIRAVDVFAGRTWVNVGRQLYRAEAGTTNFTAAHYTADSRSSASAQSRERLVFLNDSRLITIGPDGNAREDEGSPPALKNVAAFAFGNGRWVASGRTESDLPALAVSTDLKTWKIVELPDHRSTLGFLEHGNGVFVAMGSGGTCLTSHDGETWSAATVGSKEYQRLFFADGRFLAISDKVFRSSTDGVTWSELSHPVTLGYAATSVVQGTLFVFHGVATGDNAPPSYSLTRMPLPTEAQLATAKPLPTRPYYGFAHLIAEWDEKLTNARTETDRLTPTGVLVSNWRDWHPKYTKEQLFDFIHGMYDRVLAYNVSNTSVWYFPALFDEFSLEIQQAYLNTLPANTASIWRQLQNDIVTIPYNQTRPQRVQTKEYTPAAQKAPAEMDIAALRLRAAGGHVGACYDLSYFYSRGMGVPQDAAAAAYWHARAVHAGLTFYDGETDSDAGVFASWKQIADQGSAVAQVLVGDRYLSGKGVAVDQQAAVDHFRRALAAGHWNGYVRLAVCYRFGNGVAVDHEAATRLLEQAAGFGYGPAQAELGLAYEMGAGVPRDLAKAAAIYQQAADLGSIWAQVRLADMYLAGQGVAKDENRARALLQKAADAGDTAAAKAIANLAAGKHTPRKLAVYHPPRNKPAYFDIAARRAKADAGDAAAMYDLAWSSWHGYGLDPSSPAGDAWLQKAKAAGLKFRNIWTPATEALASWKELADQGSLVGLVGYAECFRDGRGTEVNHAAANAIFQRAIEAGSWEAHKQLAIQLRNGRGVKPDPEAAFRLLEKAAALGHARSLADLGWSYEAACGVARDLAKAAEYYEKAANLGDNWSVRRIGQFYLSGFGVPQDEAKGKAWLEKGVTFGDDTAATLLAQLEAGEYKPTALLSYNRPRDFRPLFDIAARRAQAEAGDAAACYDMAYALWNGYGIVEDDTAGTRWVARAKEKGFNQPAEGKTPEEHFAAWKVRAEQGSIVALGEIAFRTLNGNGTARDVAGAVPLFERAAAAGHVNAIAQMGLIYEQGSGTITADLTKAMEWYQRGADAGNAYAQMKVGYARDSGQGLPQDKTLALKYYTLAGEGGNSVAAANAAILHFRGVGTPKDEKAAAAWFLHLAGLPRTPTEPASVVAQLTAEIDRGNIDAVAPLAIMTNLGLGTASDVTEAWALAYAARYFDAGVYGLNWFDTPAINTPVAVRRAAALVADLDTADMAMISDDFEATRAELRARVQEMHREGASATTSKVAQALLKVSRGAATPADVEAITTSPEPLRIAGFAKLWEARPLETFPNGHPWYLTLANVIDEVADASAAERAFQIQLLTLPETDEERERLSTLRLIAIARLYYGFDREADKPAALAWAMINEYDADMLALIDFIGQQLTAEELAAADALFDRIKAKLDEMADDWW